MNATIQFTCPHCGHQMKLPSSTVGRQGKCAGCGQVVTITAPTVETPADGALVRLAPVDSAEQSPATSMLPKAIDSTEGAVADEVHFNNELAPGTNDVNSKFTFNGPSNLINCPDCGKQVSKNAASCPGCGCPIATHDRQPDPVARMPSRVQNTRPNTKTSANNAIVISVVGVGVFAVLIGVILYSQKATSPAKTPAEMTPAEKTAVATVKKQMTPAQLVLGDPVVNSVGVLLVPIPAGEFQMGSPDASPESPFDSKPQHLVKISKPFYLGVYEVTQQQYEKVMGVRPWQGKGNVKEGADYPAVYVSYNDAVEFCRRLSKREGVEYRLPTEAKWEYACRAGTTTAWIFGDYSYEEHSAKLGQYAWHFDNSSKIGEKYAHRVGQKLPNRWGLYDMHGNVSEWCPNKYGNAGRNVRRWGEELVWRGGSFDGNRTGSAERALHSPEWGSCECGFRVARTYSVSP